MGRVFCTGSGERENATRWSRRSPTCGPWHHALAIGYSPVWLAENAEVIRQDWPRVPLPGSADLLRASATLGARVAALLDPDAPAPGVTSGEIDPAIAAIAVPSCQGGGAMTDADRAPTAGWGHAGKGGAVMPGRGRVTPRDYAPDEAATAAHAALLGARTAGGRPLLPAEIRHVRDVARRLAALRLLGPELDANYRACAAAHVALGAPSPRERGQSDAAPAIP